MWLRILDVTILLKSMEIPVDAGLKESTARLHTDFSVCPLCRLVHSPKEIIKDFQSMGVAQEV